MNTDASIAYAYITTMLQETGESRNKTAGRLGINSAHLSFLLNDGTLSPTLKEALIDQGLEFPSRFPPRLSIRKDDADRAAGAIIRNLGEEYARELVAALEEHLNGDR